MSKHTPGPWFQRSQGGEIEIKHGIYTVCMVHDFNEPHEANIANANLIAAAPDLLEACKTIVDGYEGDGMDDMGIRDDVFYKACKEAIKKATGE